MKDTVIEPVNWNLDLDIEGNITNLIAKIRRNPNIDHHNNIDSRHIGTEFTENNETNNHILRILDKFSRIKESSTNERQAFKKLYIT